MGRKLALIIGNSRYDDTGLSRLPTADVDVRELAGVLRAPEIGGFDEIVELPDMGLAAVRRSIAQFFSQAKKDDLLVFYFSGHGVKDENGHLYLAVRDTELKLLSGTSIEAAYITSQMDRSVSKRQVLILDCCHSGAFAQGAKASASQVVGIGPAFEGTGYGHIVLTATDSTQYAWEGDRIIGESDKSVFTHYILQGLRTGEADLDGDGRITVDELYEYVYEQVVRETPKQTPGKWSYKQQGDIVVARNPNPLVRPTILPLELQAMVESPIPRIRSEAVPELEVLLHSRHPGLEAAARKALEQLRTDDSRKVSAAAQEALGARPMPTAPRLPATLYMPRQEPEPIAVDHRDLSRQRQRVSFPRSMRVQLALVAGILVIALAAAFLWRTRAPQTKSADITLPPSSSTIPSGSATTADAQGAVPPAGAAPGATGKPEPPAPNPAVLAKAQPGPTAASGATPQPPPKNEAEISRLLSMGDDLLKGGKYADAIAAYEEAARLGNAEAFGRAAKARQEQAAQVRQRLSRVGTLMDTGGYADALTQIDEALARDSKNADALSLRQKALDAQNFERSSKLSADNPFTLRHVEGALRALTPPRLSALIKDFGTTFILEPTEERRFRMAAATAKIDASQLEDVVRLLAPPRDRAAGAEWTAPTDHRQMVWIPGGTFQMGSPGNEPGREADETSHVVAIANGFWMESTEVTYGAFRKFLIENPEWQKARIDRRLHDGNYLSDWKGNVFPAGRADQPVVHVSWYAAQAYAKWAGKRLPTEGEWEYACRATRRSAYWWGDSFDTAPSGAPAFASAKNPWGLAAMLGGVWEWTGSLYRNYPFADDGRNDPAAQGPRVIRGGAGASGPNILRSANRNRDEPERCSDLLGFRCIF